MLDKLDANLLNGMIGASRIEILGLHADVKDTNKYIVKIFTLFLFLFFSIVVISLIVTLILDRRQSNFLWYVFGALQSLNLADASERML